MIPQTTKRAMWRGKMYRNCWLLTAAAAVIDTSCVYGSEETKPAQAAIPRWRGFNLTNFFQAFSRGEQGSGLLREDDLRWIRDWGFDYVRLPISLPNYLLSVHGAGWQAGLETATCADCHGSHGSLPAGGYPAVV